jgi:hypothetical protein
MKGLAMTNLDPHYPARLENAVEYAKMLARVLAAPDLAARLDRWAIGRGDEISRFVELVVSDWRSGALSEQAATEEIESYVRNLEVVLRERLQLPREVRFSAEEPSVRTLPAIARIH